MLAVDLSNYFPMNESNDNNKRTDSLSRSAAKDSSLAASLMTTASSFVTSTSSSTNGCVNFPKRSSPRNKKVHPLNTSPALIDAVSLPVPGPPSMTRSASIPLPKKAEPSEQQQQPKARNLATTNTAAETMMFQRLVQGVNRNRQQQQQLANLSGDLHFQSLLMGNGDLPFAPPELKKSQLPSPLNSFADRKTQEEEEQHLEVASRRESSSSWSITGYNNDSPKQQLQQDATTIDDAEDPTEGPDEGLFDLDL